MGRFSLAICIALFAFVAVAAGNSESQDCAKCPRYYRPVCTVEFNGAHDVYRNVRNGCLAECRNNTIAHIDLCTLKESSVFFPAIYQPVCAENGATFTNPFRAAHIALEVVHAGACTPEEKEFLISNFFKLNRPDLVNPQECFCSSQYVPVCGQDGLTYNNPCLARCFNQQNFTFGICPGDILG